MSYPNKTIKLGTSSITFPSSVTAGSLLVVVVGAEAATHTLTLTDSVGTTYSLIEAGTTTDSNKISMYAGYAGGSGANTVTGAGTLSFGTIACIELPTATIPKDVSGKVMTGTASPSISLTTTGNSRIIVAAMRGFHSANTFTSSNVTDLIQINGSDAMCLGVMQAITTGTYAPTFTIGGAGVDHDPMIAAAFPDPSVVPEGQQFTQVVIEAVGGAVPQFNMSQFAIEVVMGYSRGRGWGQVIGL